MSFLVPLFLAGGLFVAGPIIAHLIRRSTRHNVRFSDTRFLEPSAPRMTKRSRIENPWLLLLRCLAVLVLCAGFARPFIDRDVPVATQTSVNRHVVVVLDESASMQRQGLWEGAIREVRATVAGLGAGDQFALISAGLPVGALISSENWRTTHRFYREELLESAIGRRRPGWGPSPLDSGIDAALDELAVMSETSGPAPVQQIVVVSDLTEGVSVSGLAGRDWPPGASVSLVRPTIGRRANASIQSLGWTTTSGGARAARLRLAYDGAAGDSFRLRIFGAIDGRDVANPRNIPIGGGETRIVVIEIPEEHAGPVCFEIAGDGEPYDNATWLLPPQPREIVIPYIGDHAVDDIEHGRFYIARAVSAWKDPVVQLQPVNPAVPDPLPDAPLAIVAHELDSPGVSEVRRHLNRGGFVLALVDDARMLPTVEAIAGENGWAAGTIERDNALLGQIDFEHPLFLPFADPRFSNFTRIRFWRPVPFELPANSNAIVVARFDNGTPAVVEVPVGDGRLVVWGGGWSTRAGQWVLSSKFVPWLQGLAERATGGPPRPSLADPGSLAHLTGGQPALWKDPRAENATFSEEAPTAPGVYELQQNGTTRLVAVRVPPAESRNEPLPLDTWEQLGVPLQADAAAVPAETAKTSMGSAAMLENEQQLWRWALIAAIVVLALESLAAMRTARRATGAAT